MLAVFLFNGKVNVNAERLNESKAVSTKKFIVRGNFTFEIEVFFFSFLVGCFGFNRFSRLQFLSACAN